VFQLDVKSAFLHGELSKLFMLINLWGTRKGVKKIRSIS